MLDQLRQTLHLFASPPETTLAWLADKSKRVGGGVVLGVDEIALDLENWAKTSWQLVESGELSESVHASILALDRAMEAIGTDPAD